MAGISSKAMKGSEYAENKRKYNGIEFENDFDLNTYDAQLRELDPQVGRWWEIDPKIESMETWSPYASNYDNAIRYSDPFGDEGDDCCGGWWKAVKENVSGTIEHVKNNFKNEADWIENEVSSAIDQAGENFNNRWAARADPLHQILDNPFSMIVGPVGAEINLAEKVIGLEANSAKTIVSTEVKETSLTVVNEVKATGKYSNLKEPKTVGDGLKTTTAQRARILEANKKANGGVIKSDISGKVLDPPVQSKKGVPANMNQAEIDHFKQRSKGGSNRNSNLQVVSKKENLDKREKI